MNEFKEVYFDKWCITCQHEKLMEEADPCFECLDTPLNVDSNKPINWTPKG
jgi:hypothetical protein